MISCKFLFSGVVAADNASLVAIPPVTHHDCARFDTHAVNSCLSVMTDSKCVHGALVIVTSLTRSVSLLCAVNSCLVYQPTNNRCHSEGGDAARGNLVRLAGFEIATSPAAPRNDICCSAHVPLNENLPPQYRIGHNQDNLDDRRLPDSLLPSGMPDKRKFTTAVSNRA